jgi:hypothetical protein
MPHRRAEQGAGALQRALQRRSSRKALRQRQRNDSRAAPGRTLACCRSTHRLAQTSRCRGSAESHRVPGAGLSSFRQRRDLATAGKTQPAPHVRSSVSEPLASSSAVLPLPSGPRLAKARAPPEPVAVQPVRRGDGAVPRDDLRAEMWRPPRARPATASPGGHPGLDLVRCGLSSTVPPRMRWTRRSSVSL